MTKESNENNYTYTNKGAVLYYDPMNHGVLKIPEIKFLDGRGAIYEVYEVGKFPNFNIPFVTVKENGKLTLYRLPQWYLSWVDSADLINYLANEIFPSKVEFGFIISDERYYAELLDDSGEYVKGKI